MGFRDSVMDVAAPAGPRATFVPQHTPGHVLCCLCGTAIPPNPSNMCGNCIRSQVDITAGLQKQVSILWCKECGRYLQPPKHWLRADPESKELLTFCLKRLKGLQKVKLVDAGFIWTEPHSRRLKVKLTIQAEVLNGAILQQSFVVEYVVEPNMCLDCNRANTNTAVWTACVQVRQHTQHKRTFFYLEQLILKNGMDAHCTNIRDNHQGVDFFFSSRAHATRFVDFLQSVVPCRFRSDKQLVSHNEHSASYNYKYTFSVEIVPVCRDDLVCLPGRAAVALGRLGPLVLCTRVTNTLTLTDPLTLRSAHIDATAYWRAPYRALMHARQLTEYIVIDIEPLGPVSGKFVLAEAEIQRAADYGRNESTVSVKTHLGHLLRPFDHALGYDLGNANLSDTDLDAALAKGLDLPDVVLVRKSYEEKRRGRRARGHRRAWTLKRMAVEAGGENGSDGGPGAVARGRDARTGAPDRAEADLEAFMQELEEDPEMRSKLALYRDPQYIAAPAASRRPPAGAASEVMSEEEDDDEGGVPEVPLEELLDDLVALQIDDKGNASSAPGAISGLGSDTGPADMAE